MEGRKITNAFRTWPMRLALEVVLGAGAGLGCLAYKHAGEESLKIQLANGQVVSGTYRQLKGYCENLVDRVSLDVAKDFSSLNVVGDIPSYAGIGALLAVVGIEGIRMVRKGH